MAHITIEISHPVHQYLIQQAQEVNYSPEFWLQQHLSEAFGIVIPTPEKASTQGQSVLHQYVGTMLCVGTPVFERTTFQWCLPVLPNTCANSVQSPLRSIGALRSGQPTSVGELRFDAKTGALRTDAYAIYDMAEKAKEVMGLQRLPVEVHRRMEELSDQADAGTLTPSEQKELDELAEQWLNHALKNLQRLAANVNPCPTSESAS
jgi:hypothetical protein